MQSVKRTRIFTKKNIKDSIPGWLFMLPMLIGLGVFTFYPMIYSLIISFFNYDAVTVFDFVGFGNFIEIFTYDREIGKVVTNTLVFAIINIPLSIVTSYLLALLVNKPLRGIKAFRLVYYLPVMIPAVVSGLVWADAFQYYGAFNKIIGVFGIKPGTYFYNEGFGALASVFLMNMWGVGSGMVIWLAALKNIPKELYESASIDGAGAFKKLIAITIPMSTPMIFFNLVTMTIGTLQYNGPLTFAPNGGRGVDNSLYMYAVKIYNDAFKHFRYGYAGALSWLLLIVIALFTAILFKTGGWVQYREDA